MTTQEELIQEIKKWKMKLIQMQQKIDELEVRVNNPDDNIEE